MIHNSYHVQYWDVWEVPFRFFWGKLNLIIQTKKHVFIRFSSSRRQVISPRTWDGRSSSAGSSGLDVWKAARWRSWGLVPRLVDPFRGDWLDAAMHPWLQWNGFSPTVPCLSVEELKVLFLFICCVLFFFWLCETFRWLLRFGWIWSSERSLVKHRAVGSIKDIKRTAGATQGFAATPLARAKRWSFWHLRGCLCWDHGRTQAKFWSVSVFFWKVETNLKFWRFPIDPYNICMILYVFVVFFQTSPGTRDRWNDHFHVDKQLLSPHLFTIEHEGKHVCHFFNPSEPWSNRSRSRRTSKPCLSLRSSFCRLWSVAKSWIVDE